VEFYRGLDRFCQDLATGRVTRRYKAKYISWSLDKSIFCCAHLQQGGLRVWVKTNPKVLNTPTFFARDVSKIGHWGVGDVELAVNSFDRTFITQIPGNLTISFCLDFRTSTRGVSLELMYT